ncbi:hypothetical protein FD755_016260 [Muntiacus reevesi]|uniref:60S ribosomal protein L4 C-terminal domain-containing protein n=1 Tax=Muntiacus reevesi TaxID=9886 RepID=A0A5N3XEC6_MUNRE|nr:hypothetical protein FD755_016260 [Muntiacus reevesi]
MAFSSPHHGGYPSTDSSVLRKGESSGKNVLLPAVFKTPIRPDIVNFVHTSLCKNNRRPYAVCELSGHQISADSWGTGRSVAQIPRVQGSETRHSGQGAFGNRYCYHLEEAPELSLVVEGYKKTMEAALCLKILKMKNRHRIQHMGPSITNNENGGIIKAFRNIPGITLLNVSKLNILKLAPGSHVGCICIWMGNAFCKSDELVTATSPMHKRLNTDLSRILKSQRSKEPSEHHPTPQAKVMHWNTILHQAKNHKIWMNGTKSVRGKKPVVGNTGKKAVGVKEVKKTLVGKKAARTKKMK